MSPFKIIRPGDRTKKLLLGSVALIGSGWLSALARIITVVLLTRIYTKEQFGTWLTLNAVTAILVTADLGLGNVLRNRLSTLAAKGGEADREARDLFLGTFYVFGFFCLIICLLIILVGQLIPYHLLFKGAHPQSMAGGVWNFILIQIFLIMSMPFGMCVAALFSYQESHIYAAFSTFYALVGAVVFCSMAWLKFSVEITVTAYFFLTLVIYALGTALFLHRRGWWPFPVNIRRGFVYVVSMFPLGIRFFVGQISWAFLINAPTIVASAVLGVAEAALYGLVQKLFGFALQLYQSIANPLWAGYADAATRNDWTWCYKTYQRSLIVTVFVFCALTLFMLFAGNWLLNIVGGSKYIAGTLLYLMFGVLSLLTAVALATSSLQNALSNLNLIISTTTLLSLIASPFLGWMGNVWGLQGIASGAAFLMLIVSIVVIGQGKYILDVQLRMPQKP